MKIKRPAHVPMRAQRDAALLQLGLDPETAQLDHDPALGLRRVVEDGKGGWRHEPEASDPRHLVWRAKADHQHKTSGRKPGAERTATTAGSDQHRIAKVRKAERARHALLMMQDNSDGKMEAVDSWDARWGKQTGAWPKRKIPSRPWPKRGK